MRIAPLACLLTVLIPAAWPGAAEPRRSDGGKADGIRLSSPPSRPQPYEHAPIVPGFTPYRPESQAPRAAHPGYGADAGPLRSRDTRRDGCKQVYRSEYDPFGPDRRYAETQCYDRGRLYTVPGSTVRVR